MSTTITPVTSAGDLQQKCTTASLEDASVSHGEMFGTTLNPYAANVTNLGLSTGTTIGAPSSISKSGVTASHSLTGGTRYP